MKQFGIIGYPLLQSYSQKLFSAKFLREGINAEYKLYPIEDIKQCVDIFNIPDLVGLNVTLPYKEAVIPYLDELSDAVKEMRAVNVIRVRHLNGKLHLTGHNTDAIGFENSIRPLLQTTDTHALILGTGGASKAVNYVLKKLGLKTQYVSRSHKPDAITYDELTREIVEQHTVIVNATPLGMFPKIDNCAPINYEWITPNHLLYDVIYNPEKTLFLQKGEQAGARIKNGYEMLQGQAIAAWKIWNEE